MNAERRLGNVAIVAFVIVVIVLAVGQLSGGSSGGTPASASNPGAVVQAAATATTIASTPNAPGCKFANQQLVGTVIAEGQTMFERAGGYDPRPPGLDAQLTRLQRAFRGDPQAQAVDEAISEIRVGTLLIAATGSDWDANNRSRTDLGDRGLQDALSRETC
jgi:hypothetical protein